MKLNDKYPAPVLTVAVEDPLLEQIREMRFRDMSAHERRFRSSQCRVIRKAILPQDEGFDRAVRLIEDNDFGEVVM